MLVTNTSGLHIPHHDYLSISPIAAMITRSITILLNKITLDGLLHP
jgi:hypothetical protein